MVPQPGGEQPGAGAPEVGRFLVQQDAQEEVIVDDYVQGKPPSGQIGLFGGHLGGKLGVPTGRFDRLAEQAA